MISCLLLQTTILISFFSTDWFKSDPGFRVNIVWSKIGPFTDSGSKQIEEY